MTGPLSTFPIRFAQWAFILAVVPFTYVLFFARYWRESGKKPTEHWERPMLLAMVGSSLLLSVAPAPSLGRMGPSVFPGIILLGWFLDSPRKLARALAASFAVGVLLIVTHTVAGFQSREKSILKMPPGPIAITDLGLREELAWVEQHTRPSEYFYATSDPGLYFYGDLRNPTPLPFVTDTGYTTPQQVADVIRGLEQHHVRYISWDGVELGSAADWRNPAEHRLGPLWAYIQSHYQRVKIITDSAVVLERKD